jgi:hypothetical protein
MGREKLNTYEDAESCSYTQNAEVSIVILQRMRFN